MEEATAIVVKVRYGDVLRRFSTWISDDEVGVNMDGLKEKILSLFKLPRNTTLMLTYIDQDGDEVMLVDDDDLRDIRRQKLNPLRITVKLTSEKNGGKHHSSGSSTTPFKSPLAQKPFRSCESAREPLSEAFVKLSTKLASKVSSSKPNITELIHYFLDVCSLYLAYISPSQYRAQTRAHNFVMEHSETSKADAAQSTVRSNVGSEEFMKENESLAKLELLATVIDDAVKHRDTSVVGTETSFATRPDFNAVGLDSQTIKAGRALSDSLRSSGPTADSRVVPSMAGKKEKLDQIKEHFSKYKSSLRSSHRPSVANKDWVAGISDVSSNVQVKNAISPEPELDLVNPSSKKNTSTSPLHPAFGAVTLNANSSLNDYLSKSCHQDYYCDDCGADPIFGPRFRSKVKEDYDLCIICFSGMETDSDYIRIDCSEDDHHKKHLGSSERELSCES